jgi:hypothetical protein
LLYCIPTFSEPAAWSTEAPAVQGVGSMAAFRLCCHFELRSRRKMKEKTDISISFV